MRTIVTVLCLTIGIPALICIATVGKALAVPGCVWSQFAADTPRLKPESGAFHIRNVTQQAD